MFGEDLRPSFVDEQGGVPGREEPDRGRGVAVGEWCSRKIVEHLAAFAPESTQPHPREASFEARGWHAGPARDLLRRGRAEPTEVPSDQELDALRLVDLRYIGPPVGQAVEIGAPPLPGPGGRDADQIHPQAQAVPDPRLDA